LDIDRIHHLFRLGIRVGRAAYAKKVTLATWTLNHPIRC
jgi:hypothetical protein